MKIRRFLSLICIFAVTLSMTVGTCSATDLSKAPNEKTYILFEGEDGVWHDAPVARGSGVLVEHDSNYENIYKTKNGEYYKMTKDSTFLPAEKVHINLNDKNAVNHLREQYDINTYIYEDIINMSKFAYETNSENAAVEFFVSTAPLAVRAGTVMDDEYSEYDGIRFVHRQIYFVDIYTMHQPIVEGPSFGEAALRAIKDLVVKCIGEKVEVIGDALSLYSDGKSFYDHFKEVNGYYPIINKSPENCVTIDVCYNVCLKYTFFELETNGLPSLRTQKARIKSIETLAYLLTEKGMERTEDNTICDDLYYSTHFLNPDPFAAERGSLAAIYTENVVGYVGEVPVMFTWPALPPDFP